MNSLSGVSQNGSAPRDELERLAPLLRDLLGHFGAA
jgi:hypothetical protein